MENALKPMEQLSLSRAAAAAGIPGAAAAIVHGGQVRAGLVGHANLEEKRLVTADSLFPLASVTKSFTATAVMQLVEAGHLALDRPVVDYLPGFRVADPLASRQITVRMLLNHTSGLGRTGHLDPTVGAGYTSRAELVDALPTAELQTPPGEAWSYSNEAFSVGGHLVDVAAGHSFEEQVERRILAHLGMEATTTDITQWHRSPHRAWGYALDDEGTAQRVPDLPIAPASLPAGRICSTIRDLARYLAATMDYEQNPVLSPSALAEMHRATFQWGDTGWGYGLGWFIQHGPGGRVVSHGGNQIGTATYLLMLPDEGLGVAVLTNLSGAPARQIAEELANLALGRPVLRSSTAEPLPIRSRYEVDLDQLADCAGVWTSRPGEVRVTHRDGRLGLEQRLRQGGAVVKMEGLPIGEDLAMVVQGGSEGMPVRFLRGPSGGLDRMLLAGTLYRRG